MFVHIVLLRIYLQALIVTVSDGSEPRVSQWIRSYPLSWFKWGSYASSLLICFPKLIEIALVARAAGHHDWLRQSGSGCPDCFSATRHACARSHRACALYRDMQSRNIGTCRPVTLSPIGRRFVPSLTAQALTTVFPFPISTCQNIITLTVFESLYP